MEIIESSSSWMVALGKTLVHSIWIGFLFLGILKVFLRLIPGGFSGIRYRMAVASLLLFTGVVIAMFGMLYAPPEKDPGDLSTLMLFLSHVHAKGGILDDPATSPARILYRLCGCFYFAGIAILCIRSFLAVRNIRAIRKKSTPVRGFWQNKFLRIVEDLGIRKRISLSVSQRIDAPCVIGLLKPAIIVPAAMLSHLQVNQVETIFMHELYHVKRLDFLVNLLQMVLESLFFYHPAIWSISGIIRKERENCCDDRVMGICHQPFTYARALYKLAELAQPSSVMLIRSDGANTHHLYERISRILKPRTMKIRFREKTGALLLLAGCCILLITITGFSSGLSIIKNHDGSEKVTPISATEAESGSVLVKRPTNYMPVVPVRPDTIPDAGEEAPGMTEESPEEIDREEIEEEIRMAREEALDDIDWEAMKEELERAREEALNEIDWEAMKEELERARVEMDSLMKDIEFEYDFDFDVDLDVDTEKIRMDIEEAMKEMEEIDWDEIRKELEESRAEIENIDVEQIRKEVEQALKEIDIEELRKE